MPTDHAAHRALPAASRGERATIRRRVGQRIRSAPGWHPPPLFQPRDRDSQRSAAYLLTRYILGDSPVLTHPVTCFSEHGTSCDDPQGVISLPPLPNRAILVLKTTSYQWDDLSLRQTVAICDLTSQNLQGLREFSTAVGVVNGLT